MRAIQILHNPRAGSLANARKVEQAANALARRGVAVHLARPSSIEELRQCARDAVAAQADAVLVAGGDGTLGAIAGELAGSSVALGALPAGTANVWARTLGISRPGLARADALERAALLLAESPARLTDMGRCNDDYFLIWASAGLDAFVVRQFEARRQAAPHIGGFLYNFMLTLAVTPRWRGIDLRASISGPGAQRELSGRYIMLTVANTGWHGGGLLQVTDQARLDDGLMEVWAAEGESYADALAHTARVLRGVHHRHPAFQCLTADKVEIYTATPQAYHLDAEPLMFTSQLSIQIVPRCLRMLVPPAAARRLYQ